MWWFRGLHGNLLAAWRAAGAADAGGGERRVLLDAGCGTGGFLARLAAGVPGALACGIELDEPACRAARAKSGCAVAVGSVDRLPLRG